MRDTEDQRSVSRRRYIKYASGSAVAISAGLAGCSGDGESTPSGDGDGGRDGDDDTSGTSTTARSSGPDSVQLGSLHSLSGVAAASGVKVANGVELAVQLKNEAGGIDSLDGAEIELLNRDHEGKQELAGEEANRLVQDEDPVAILGTMTSPTALAVAPVCEQANVVFHADVASTPQLTKQGYEYTFRTQANSDQATMDYTQIPKAIRSQGATIETAGVYHMNNATGEGNMQVLEEELPKIGIEITEETVWDFGESDANTQATKLREADPDLIVVEGYEAGTVRLIDAMDNLGYTDPFVTGAFGGFLGRDDVAATMPSWMEGAMNTNIPLDWSKNETTEIKNEYESRFDDTFQNLHGYGYSCTAITLEAIEKAGSADPTDVRDAHRNEVFPDHILAMPTVNYGSDGTNQNAVAGVYQLQGDELAVVLPEQFAEVDMIPAKPDMG